MTREVYTDQEFIQFSKSQVFMRVFQDTESQGDALATKYRVPGFPTLLILDSSGHEVDRVIGFRPAPDLIRELKSIFKDAESGDGRITI